MKEVENLIVGAGPAGLAVAGRMRKAGLDFEILEQSQNIGNSWHHHYDRLHLHTVKQWSHLPHLEFPEDYPLYVPRKKLIDYFYQYAETFNIDPHFDKKVIAIKDKRVLIIGMGNTGAEVALDLAENGVTTYISVRSPISVVPRDLNGRPAQVTAKYLAKIPFGLGDWLGSKIRSIYFGDIRKYNLEPSTMYPAVQLRETGKTPIVDIGTIAAIKAGKIKVVKDIEQFTADGVEFKNGEYLQFDAILLATGYHAKVEEFLERGSDLLDKYGCPKGPIGEDFHQGIYFIGFDNYKLGGILGTINSDSATIVNHISNTQK